jgi:phenylacetate-CoA ligase
MYNAKMETLSRKNIEELQIKKLKETVKLIYENVPFYKARLDSKGIKPRDIKTLNDITKLPFTTKDDLRNNMPFGFMATPLDSCIELHASSGTTGVPITVCYTHYDIEIWGEVMARCLSMAGLTHRDIFQNPIPYGTFTGAFGYHYGAQKIGALTIPSGKGQSERQLTLMKEYGTTFLSGVASYILYLGQKAMDIGINPSRLKVRNGMFGAETFSEGMKKRIEEQWEMDVHDVYGLTEMCGPGVSADCDVHDGLHFWEDHFFFECINPTTGEPVDAEEKGELVITTLTKEGMPLLRYRTRDLAYIYDAGKCECGRTHRRHSTIKGRSDDMVIIKGTNIYPGQIESALMAHPMIGTNWHIILKTEDMDQLLVEAESKVKIIAAEKKHKLERELQRKIGAIIALTPQVKIVPPGSIPLHGIKAKRVIDQRKNN